MREVIEKEEVEINSHEEEILVDEEEEMKEEEMKEEEMKEEMKKGGIL